LGVEAIEREKASEKKKEKGLGLRLSLSGRGGSLLRRRGKGGCKTGDKRGGQ